MEKSLSPQIAQTGTPGTPGGDKVVFHLHPSFRRAEDTLPLIKGSASLELVAWGAFTVGAEVLDRSAQQITKLELDLATLADAPDTFRNR